MNHLKKLLFVVAAVVLLGAGSVHAQTTITPTVNPSNSLLTPCADGSDCYQLLEPLPTADPTKDLTNIDVNATGSEGGIGGFINFAMELGIGIAGVLGVVMLVIYGFQYAANDQNVGNFEVVKKKITNVVLGLMLLLGITIILRTINPDLLIVEPRIEDIALDSVNPGSDGGFNIKGAAKATSDNDRSWVQTYSKKLRLKNRTTGQDVLVSACDDSQIQTVSAFGRSFRVHKGAVASLMRVDAKWRAAGGNSFYKIPASNASAGAMGGYVCRTVRGSSAISWHSYGLAIDINPAENPMQGSLKTDMPAAFVKMWTDEGWGWGGRWNRKKDAMHFSKISNEGGDMLLD